MSNTPSTSLGFDPVTGQPLPPQPPVPLSPTAPPAVDPKQLIAPWWHTVVIVAIILGNSYFAAGRLSHNVQNRSRILLYLSTIAWQIVLFGLVWIGLRLKKTKMRDLIGGRWNAVEDFLLDVVIAGGFWI